jgi:hypothetical protein
VRRRALLPPLLAVLLGCAAAAPAARPGVYRSTVVVRRRRYLPATRFWLQQRRGGLTVARAFCMTPQWLRGGARLRRPRQLPRGRGALPRTPGVLAAEAVA